MNAKIALAQFHIHLGNPLKNLEKCLLMINKSSVSGCDLVLFPELWTTGYDLENCCIHCETNQEILSVIQQECINKKIAVGGSYITRTDGKFRNTFILIDSAGAYLPQYDKLHLIKLFNEEKYFTAGEKTQLNSFSWGKAGLSICYDLRFPEIYRSMAIQGAEIFLITAEWPLSRIEHWNTLLKARAIENQVYLAAVNCVGKTGQDTFGGSSVIVSPGGNVLAAADSKREQLVIQEIEPADIFEYRKSMNILDDRRRDIY